ncbi:hypothetical protein ACFL96_00360 [Thermoproteota archaeon]
MKGGLKAGPVYIKNNINNHLYSINHVITNFIQEPLTLNSKKIHSLTIPIPKQLCATSNRLLIKAKSVQDKSHISLGTTLHSNTYPNYQSNITLTKTPNNFILPIQSSNLIHLEKASSLNKIPSSRNYISLDQNSLSYNNSLLDQNSSFTKTLSALHLYISCSENCTIELDKLILIGQPLAITNLNPKNLKSQEPIQTFRAPTGSLEINQVTIVDSIAPIIHDLQLNSTPINEHTLLSNPLLINLCITEMESGLASWNIILKNLHSLKTQTICTGNENGQTGTIPLDNFHDSPLSPGRYSLIVSAEDKAGNLSHTFESLPFFLQSYLTITNLLIGPNPYNPTAKPASIQYTLNQDSEVKISIYSLSGEELWHKIIAAGHPEGGAYGINTVTWNGINKYGETLANGAYIIYLTAQSGRHRCKAKTKLLVLK